MRESYIERKLVTETKKRGGLCEKWKDTITTIRIDPANAVGTYYIDEVMIMEVVE